MESLDIGGTKFTDDGVAHLASAVWLKNLTLNGTQLTPALLVHLRRLPQLSELHLYLWYGGSKGDRFGPPPIEEIDKGREAMKLLGEFPELTELDTRGNLMVPEVLTPVTKLAPLQRFKVDGRYVSHQDFRRMQEAMPHCHVQRMNDR